MRWLYFLGNHRAGPRARRGRLPAPRTRLALEELEARCLLSDGYIFTTLDVPGATSTRAFGINDSAQIVGDYIAAGANHGFLISEGSYTTLDVPGSTFTAAHRINDSGQIVGWYIAAGRNHGFLLSEGSYTTIDPPGSIFTQALGINDSGQIVG